MMDIRRDVMLIAGALVLGALAYVTVKGARGAVADATAGAVGVAADAASGVVLGVGDVLGVPRTNETECERAVREGRTWDASFACPAGTFLGYLFN